MFIDRTIVFRFHRIAANRETTYHDDEVEIAFGATQHPASFFSLDILEDLGNAAVEYGFIKAIKVFIIEVRGHNAYIEVIRFNAMSLLSQVSMNVQYTR